MAREFLVPNRIISGEDSLAASADYISQFGKKALIVTDPSMIKFGLVQKLVEILEANKIDYSIFSDVVGEPTDKIIDAGKVAYETNDCDFLIAIGGGSPLDSMKAIAAVVNRDMSINDYYGKTIEGDLPYMVAIPTTAGTGSEATQFTIITNTEKDIKMLLKGSKLIPNLAVVDPEFTLTLPASVTAATGLDALCHAVESYASVKAQPLSKTFSAAAARRIFKWLPEAYAHGDNKKAREQMSLAALEAGIAFNNSSVTIIHGMSRPIGALYHVPHGLSNAMLIKVCIEHILDGAYEQFGALARECELADFNDTDKQAAEKLLDAMCELVDICNVPTLEMFGIDKKDFMSNVAKMSKDAMDSGSPQNCFKSIETQDIEELYRKLW